MKIVPTGHFESALARLYDGVNAPNRNVTGHPYYLDLNRNIDSIYTSGISTFNIISEKVIVPWELDWSEQDVGKSAGIIRSVYSKTDEDWKIKSEIIEKIVKLTAKKGFFSVRSHQHITNLNMMGYDSNVVQYVQQKLPKSEIVESYTRRLLFQLSCARESDAFLLVGEPELLILREIGNLLKDRPDIIFSFPDVESIALDPQEFLNGILEFNPPDIESLITVRQNSEIQGYASRVRKEFLDNGLAGLNKAAVDAYLHSEACKDTKRVFDVMSWAVKPLHYIPGVDALLGFTEDVKDIVLKAIDFRNRYADWHLIGVKMHTIAIEDYLRRVHNRL